VMRGGSARLAPPRRAGPSPFLLAPRSAPVVSRAGAQPRQPPGQAKPAAFAGGLASPGESPRARSPLGANPPARAGGASCTYSHELARAWAVTPRMTSPQASAGRPRRDDPPTWPRVILSCSCSDTAAGRRD
jgi:hypothetical protein